MTTIQILVRVIESFDVDLPDPPVPGDRFLFSNDLALERDDDSTPGSGLAQNEAERLAGTHSGFVTLLRVAGVNDRFFRRAVNSGSTTPHTSSTPWTTLLCRRGRSPHEASSCFRATTSWSHPFGSRSLVARDPTQQLMEPSLRGSQQGTTGCSISSCSH